MFFNSIKSENELQSSNFESLNNQPSFFPKKATIENYAHILLFGTGSIQGFTNSCIVSLTTMSLTLFLSVLASYGLSRFNFKLKNPYKIALFFTQMVPSISFLLPFYLIFFLINKYLNIPLKQTYIGLILCYTSFSLPFAVLMLTRYFDAVPKELDDQAMIDGCSRFKVLFKIIIPTSLPGIYSIAIYSFLISWNEILFASMLTDRSTRTISVGILEIGAPAHMMAACVLVSIPILIVFSYLQKYCINVNKVL
jgi:multiple sugar transport system permease protein